MERLSRTNIIHTKFRFADLLWHPIWARLVITSSNKLANGSTQQVVNFFSAGNNVHCNQQIYYRNNANLVWPNSAWKRAYHLYRNLYDCVMVLDICFYRRSSAFFIQWKPGQSLSGGCVILDLPYAHDDGYIFYSTIKAPRLALEPQVSHYLRRFDADPIDKLSFPG